MLRVAQAEYMIEALILGEIETGQEMGFAMSGDTRCGISLRNCNACYGFASFNQGSPLEGYVMDLHP